MFSTSELASFVEFHEPSRHPGNASLFCHVWFLSLWDAEWDLIKTIAHTLTSFFAQIRKNKNKWSTKHRCFSLFFFHAHHRPLKSMRLPWIRRAKNVFTLWNEKHSGHIFNLIDDMKSKRQHWSMFQNLQQFVIFQKLSALRKHKIWSSFTSKVTIAHLTAHVTI